MNTYSVNILFTDDGSSLTKTVKANSPFGANIAVKGELLDESGLGALLLQSSPNFGDKVISVYKTRAGNIIVFTSNKL